MNEKNGNKKVIALFNDQPVRRVWNAEEEKWYFSVVDVVRILAQNDRPRKYWDDLKRSLKSEGSELSDKIGQLKLPSSDGKLYETDCANTETVFRIIQTVSSPKAEPFKRWLAKVGYERIQEIEDPELATKRTRALYKAKGYLDSWIEKRMRGIEVRETLTDEWKKRNVGGELEYAILTAEISQATFGMTPSQYKKFKNLKRENLRDHMNDLELIFSMLGEASTTEIARNKDTKGFGENKKAARQGGAVAGTARRQLEKKSGKKVSTKRNYLPVRENEQLI